MPSIDFEDGDLDSVAWDFLRSEFAGPIYADWPIDRRLEGYLRHRGLTAVADDGTAAGDLLEHVMSNIGPALRRGVLSLPNFTNRPDVAESPANQGVHGPP